MKKESKNRVVIFFCLVGMFLAGYVAAYHFDEDHEFKSDSINDGIQQTWQEWAELQSKKTMFENWGNFLVTYDNESCILETYSYSDGTVIISIKNEHNLIVYCNDWNYYNYAKNFWCFDTSPGQTTIHRFNFNDYPDEVFVITVCKDIYPFPYDYEHYQWRSFDPVKRTIVVGDGD